MNFEYIDKLPYQKIIEEDSINIESIEQGTNLYHDFIVYKDEEIINIYDRICDHNGGRLCKHNEKIVCPYHGWEFNPENGGYDNVQVVKKKEDFKVTAGKIIIPREIYTPKLPNTNIKRKITIDYMSHACLIFKSDDFSFATDPWLDGFAFASGWWLKHNPPKDWIEKLNEVDFIYISHNHPDHLNEFTLSKIRKDMEFIIPEFQSKSVEKILLKLGFNNFTNFGFDSYYQFKHTDLFFSILKSGDFRDDSGFYFTYGDFSFFSTVDSNDLNFGRFPEKITIFARSFSSGDSGHPLSFENIDEYKKSEILARNAAVTRAIVINDINKINSKYFLPYAGFFKESALRDKNILQHNKKNTIEDYENLLKSTDTYCLNVIKNDSYNFYGSELVSSQKLDRESTSINPENFMHKVFSGINIDSDYIQKFFINSDFQDNLIVFFELTDDDFVETSNFFIVDFSSNIPTITFKEFKWEIIKSAYRSQTINNLRIKVRKNSFDWVLKNNLPFEDLLIGFQCKIDRVPDYYNVNFWNHFTNVYI
jgi:CMP-N-acetylneuraminate monooxygenase